MFSLECFDCDGDRLDGVVILKGVSEDDAFERGHEAAMFLVTNLNSDPEAISAGAEFGIEVERDGAKTSFVMKEIFTKEVFGHVELKKLN